MTAVIDSAQPAATQERQLSCPNCGYYVTSTTAPWGRIKAYCRGACRKYVYVYLGKPPESDALYSDPNS